MNSSLANTSLQHPEVVQHTIVRDTSGYSGREVDKPTAWQSFTLKFKQFLGAFSGVLGGALSVLFPGVGSVAAAGLYGVGKLAKGSADRQQAKMHAETMSGLQPTVNPQDLVIPGYNWGNKPSIQFAPYNDGLYNERSAVVGNRAAASQLSVDRLQGML